MPYLIEHNSNVANMLDLAANQGLYANQQAADAGQRQQQAETTHELSTILTDERDREARAQQTSVAMAGQQNQLNIANQRDTASTANTQTRMDAAGLRNDLNIGARKDIASGRLGFEYDSLGARTDNNDVLHNDRVAAATDKVNRTQSMIDHQNAEAEARLNTMAQLQAGKIDAISAKNSLMAQKQEMQQRREYVAKRIDAGDKTADYYAAYDRITHELQELDKATQQASAVQGPPIQVRPTVVPPPTPRNPAFAPAAPNFLPPQNLSPEVQQPAPPPASQAQPSQQPVQVQTREQALSLPSGTVFMTPDGQIKVRP